VIATLCRTATRQAVRLNVALRVITAIPPAFQRLISDITVTVLVSVKPYAQMVVRLLLLTIVNAQLVELVRTLLIRFRPIIRLAFALAPPVKILAQMARARRIFPPAYRAPLFKQLLVAALIQTWQYSVRFVGIIISHGCWEVTVPTSIFW